MKCSVCSCEIESGQTYCFLDGAPTCTICFLRSRFSKGHK